MLINLDRRSKYEGEMYDTSLQSKYDKSQRMYNLSDTSCIRITSSVIRVRSSFGFVFVAKLIEILDLNPAIGVSSSTS